MKVGLGIIGLDNWYHALPLCPFPHEEIPDARMVAISDPVKSRVNAMQLPQKWGCQYYRDYNDLLKNPQIDAVIVDACTATHAEITIAAAEAGKHILVDKPFATSLDDADKMIKAAEKADVKLGTSYNFRYRAPYVRAKEIIDEGMIGKPCHGMFITTANLPEDWPGTGKPGWFADPSKAGGGGFADHAAHTTDVMRWLFKNDAKQVSAEMANLVYRDIGNEDYGVATIRLKNDAICIVESSWTNIPGSGFGETVSIHGEEGDLCVRSPYILVFGKTRPFRDRVCITYDEPFNYVLRETHTKLVKEFVSCIIEDKKPPISGEDGRASLEILLAAYKSAKSRRTINLAERTSKNV